MGTKVLKVDLSTGDFSLFYHGKSPSNHYLGEYVFCCFQASNQQIHVESPNSHFYGPSFLVSLQKAGIFEFFHW